MLSIINTIKINRVNGLGFDFGVALIFLFQPKGRKTRQLSIAQLALASK